MPESKYFSDLHCHPTLKPFRYYPPRSIWDEIPYTEDEDNCAKRKIPWVARGIAKEFRINSKTHLNSCCTGKVRLVFTSLYPPERKMFDVRPLMDLLMQRKKKINLGACITGFDRRKIEEYLRVMENNGEVDYFGELEEEYEYLIQQAEESKYRRECPNADKLLIIGENYEQARQALKDEHNLVTILTVEGAHSFMQYDTSRQLKIPFSEVDNPDNPIYQHILEKFEDSIGTVKQWGNGRHAPFFVTFAHHFWNLLCGHAKTFGGLIGNHGYDQNQSINTGFTALGREVLKLLLSRENGRRILIDIKHMSARSRKEFYHTWREYQERGDEFPIICSHAAVNGFPRLSDWEKYPDTDAIIQDYYLNPWSINLYDEDLHYIHASRGLIGLILHEDRMPGGIARKLLNKAKNRPAPALRKEYASLLLSNAFHIIRTLRDKSAWNLLCIGSDLDGVINIFDSYPDLSTYPQLAEDLRQFMDSNWGNEYMTPALTKEEKRELMYGYTAEEIVDKIMFRNTEDFLERYFQEAYLLEGVTELVHN